MRKIRNFIKRHPTLWNCPIPLVYGGIPRIDCPATEERASAGHNRFHLWVYLSESRAGHLKVPD